MTALRWWLFKWLSAIIWPICPEPHRSDVRGLYALGLDHVRRELDKQAVR